MKRWLALAALLGLLSQSASADIAFYPKTALYVATAGPVTLTGIVPETNMVALRIPGGSMGPNGVIEVSVLWNYTNSANSKQAVVRFNQTAGVVGGSTWGPGLAVTTTASAQTKTIYRNNNATNVQAFFTTASPTAPFGTAATASGAGNVDTTQDAYVNISGNIVTAGETMTLVHAYAVVYKQ
jgi:hypothetical protein